MVLKCGPTVVLNIIRCGHIVFVSPFPKNTLISFNKYVPFFVYLPPLAGWSIPLSAPTSRVFAARSILFLSKYNYGQMHDNWKKKYVVVVVILFYDPDQRLATMVLISWLPGSTPMHSSSSVILPVYNLLFNLSRFLKNC